MIRYPLPPQLTHDQFRSIVGNLCHQLTKHGIDPVSNTFIDERDEILSDGTTLTYFSLIVSDEAADILKQSLT